MLDAPSTPSDAPALVSFSESAPPAHASVQPQTVAADFRSARIPHLGHVALLTALMLGGLVSAVGVMFAAVYVHLFGVARLEDTMHSMAYAVGTMAVLYLVAFAPAAAIFPSLWGRSLLAGLQWNTCIVRRRWPLLMLTGVVCFGLAFFGRLVLHFPDHSPLEGMLSTPQAVWIMFVFAVTVAPLCEEIMFRGFLLPALSTAWDWSLERITGRTAPVLLEGGHPQWSMPGMIFASAITSAVFALFHFTQDGSALGPMILIFAVSLVLCAVRLSTRSLAASTLTHATYNFTVFVVSALTTQGFTHLHK